MNSLRSLLRRGGAFSMVIALGMLLVACSTPAESSAPGESTDSSGGGTVAVVDGVVELTAAGLLFDASVIQAPVGEAFTISFTNDDSTPHNVAIDTQEGGDEIVVGDIIDPGQSVDIEVPAQDAGEYFFVCDLHPEMNGAVVVE